MTRQSVRIIASLVIIGVGSAAVLAFGGCSAGIQDLPLGRSADGDAYNVALQLAGADGLVLGADVRSGQKVILAGDVGSTVPRRGRMDSLGEPGSHPAQRNPRPLLPGRGCVLRFPCRDT